MNVLALIPLRAWLAAGIALALFIGAGWFGAHERNVGRAQVQVQWDAERARLQAQIAAQNERNIELQRQAEKRYTVQAQTRDRVITQTITEVRNATVSLASCPVPAGAISLLNAASRCASEDSAAACGAGDAVQPPQ